MLDQVEAAEFVIVVCTETYNQRFRGDVPEGSGKGVKWEGAVITQQLYDAEMNNTKFIPVVFKSDDAQHIPIILRGATHFVPSSNDGYENLYRLLTNQPESPKPQLGKPLSLKPRDRPNFV